MEPEKKLTHLEEKWKAEAKDEVAESTKLTLDDAYTEEGKVAEHGLSDSVLDLYSATHWMATSYPALSWRLKTTKGGIVLADETRQRTQLATNVGYVLKVGGLSYADESKFPHGPWCKPGDWVIFWSIRGVSGFR